MQLVTVAMPFVKLAVQRQAWCKACRLCGTKLSAVDDIKRLSHMGNTFILPSQVCIPNSKPRVFSSNDLTSLGAGAWSGCGTGAATGGPETVMVRQYGFPSCQGSAPSSAPATTGFVPPTGHRQVGLLKGVAAKPPLSNSPSSGMLNSISSSSVLTVDGGQKCAYKFW